MGQLPTVAHEAAEQIGNHTFDSEFYKETTKARFACDCVSGGISRAPNLTALQHALRRRCMHAPELVMRALFLLFLALLPFGSARTVETLPTLLRDIRSAYNGSALEITGVRLCGNWIWRF